MTQIKILQTKDDILLICQSYIQHSIYFPETKKKSNVIISESTMTFQYSIRLIIIELNTKLNETKQKDKKKKRPIQF